MTPETPATLGRYEIVRELGRGAMGVVYLANDPLIGRQVALKTFRPGVATDEVELSHFRTRFIREAQSAGILSQHPGIVTIHDVVWGEGDGGVTFIAMEYVEGVDLKSTLRRGRRLPHAQVVDVVSQIADAIDHAHSKGVVHRDIKPANVIVTPTGRVKITDFGVARLDTSNLTHDGQMLGTPNYMAPEQVEGREVDHRADIFSLGVIVYELLTGKKPFQGENLTIVTHRIVHADFTPPETHVDDLPPEVGAVLRRALEKDPERRFQRAGDLADELALAIGLRRAEGPGVNDTRGLPPAAAPEAVAAAGGPPLPPEIGEDTVPSSIGTGAAAGAGSGTGAAPPADRRPSVLRLVALGAIAAAVALAVGLGLLGLAHRAGGRDDSPAVDSASLRRTVELSELLREGHRRLLEGDALAAAAAFRSAERLAPGRPEIRTLREVAEVQAETSTLVGVQEQQLALRLEAARRALAGGRYQEAIGTAEAVLAERPDHPEAREVISRARRALERDRAARTAELERREEAQEAAAEAAAVPAAPPEPARLVIEFVGTPERPEGTLIVDLDGTRIVSEPFAFYDRVGLFRRKQPYRGKITVPARTVDSGARSFQIWVVENEGDAVEATELSGNFPPGVERRLDIRLTQDGKVDARLE